MSSRENRNQAKTPAAPQLVTALFQHTEFVGLNLQTQLGGHPAELTRSLRAVLLHLKGAALHPEMPYRMHLFALNTTDLKPGFRKHALSTCGASGVEVFNLISWQD